MYLQEGEEGAGTSGCCAVVRGTTIQGIAVRRIATTTTRTTTTTTSGFGLWFPARALFCARVGVWECVERALEESRPVPVMSATASENQTGLGSLVGVKAERLPSLQYPEFDSHSFQHALKKPTVFYSSQSDRTC
ncbi:hypothetical protein [Fischerella sp. PCC 9605]|uniref:hypothetical protein n=1 Tax=Fischerella sp. PCC 9605 TaxID=1173024 RepID=UPI003FA40A48